ncbi:DNA gyrase inhibitor YacG [Methylophilaceae bacterium]|nr:DNA gyrase inhibitor YacG [Methylophilaceae bacterium]
MEASKNKRMVACPQCHTLTEFNEKNPYRPFCSKLCTLIDLGQWASENYRVPDTSNLDEELSEPHSSSK